MMFRNHRAGSRRPLAAAAALLLLSATTVVQADSPAKAVKQVSPDYPERAAGAEGWVELEFTVGADGKVRNVSVLKAEPARTFEVAAVRAIQRWTFEPATKGGTAVDSQERRRFVFKP